MTWRACGDDDVVIGSYPKISVFGAPRLVQIDEHHNLEVQS